MPPNISYPPAPSRPDPEMNTARGLDLACYTLRSRGHPVRGLVCADHNLRVEDPGEDEVDEVCPLADTPPG